jgi:hypothetical protein
MFISLPMFDYQLPFVNHSIINTFIIFSNENYSKTHLNVFKKNSHMRNFFLSSILSSFFQMKKNLKILVELVSFQMCNLAK